MSKRKKLIIINIILYLLGTFGLVYYKIQDQNPANTNRDKIFVDLTYLSNHAKSYFSNSENAKKGKPSFEGWKVPEKIKKSDNAIYEITNDNHSIHVKAIGNAIGYDNKTNVKIIAEISYSKFNFSILN